MFDIVFVRLINTFLILGLIIWIRTLSKRTKNSLLSVPLLTWLFQAFFFYIVYFAYHYGVIIIPLPIAENLFSYWTTFSKLLFLMTLTLYLYYIQNSCWRGNGK